MIEFQLSYLKSWKMVLLKCYTQHVSKFGKLSSDHKTGKGQLSFQFQRRAMPKNVQRVKVLVIQLRPTLCDPMYCGLPDSSVHGILQARILGWVAISFSRGSSWPRDRNQVCSAGRIFTVWATNYHTVELISHASNVMLKILQARLHQHMNKELPNSRCSSWI